MRRNKADCGAGAPLVPAVLDGGAPLHDAHSCLFRASIAAWRRLAVRLAGSASNVAPTVATPLLNAESSSHKCPKSAICVSSAHTAASGSTSPFDPEGNGQCLKEATIKIGVFKITAINTVK